MTMTLQLTIAACSVIGAALFFAAGYMLARIHPFFSAPDSSVKRASAADPDAAAEPLEILIDTLAPDEPQKAKTRAAEADTVVTGKAVNELRARQLREAREKLKNAAAYILRLKNYAERLAREKQALEQEKGKLEQEKKSLQDQLQALESAEAERKRLSLEVAELKNRTDAATELQAEKENLSAQLQEARDQVQGLSAKIESKGTVEEENKDLSLRVEMLNEQLEEMEDLQEENSRLKAQQNAIQEMESEIAALKSENANLQSMKIVQAGPPQPVMHFTEEGLGAVLQHLVNRLSESENARGAVLADELGLMIAGTGAHSEAMAGIAAVFAETSAQLQNMLPLGEIDHMQIVNQNDLNLTIRPLSVSDHEMILTTLSVGRGPDRNTIENLMQEIASSD
ncbi:MAG: hypothetical protein K9K82_14540 [Desulfobacteraceae bacterium]|nr:hypothetical protein [Desulfobacteraceae bacterium]